MRCPLHEVLRWPAWVLDAYAAFLRREPMPEERTEIAVAQLTHFFAAAHTEKGSPVPSTADLLLFRDTWDLPSVMDDERYSDVDREILRAMGT